MNASALPAVCCYRCGRSLVFRRGPRFDFLRIAGRVRTVCKGGCPHTARAQAVAS